MSVSDFELVQQVQRGQMAAFAELVRLHTRSVYNMAFRYVGDHGQADDVVQESFVKAYQNIQSFRGESSFKSWLLRITINNAKNALRARSGKHFVDLEDVDLVSVAKEFSSLEHQQTGELLKRAVAKLPDRQRQALELRVYEDMSFQEVAAAMDCPFDTAKANFRHAVMNLKKMLATADGGKALEELRLAFESGEEGVSSGDVS